MQTAKRRTKPRIAEMLPVKKLLSLREACSYMDLSQNNFETMVAENGLSIYTLPVRNGGKRSNAKYYKITELDEIILDNPIIKKVK
jgi:hypothetical protein